MKKRQQRKDDKYVTEDIKEKRANDHIFSKRTKVKRKRRGRRRRL